MVREGGGRVGGWGVMAAPGQRKKLFSRCMAVILIVFFCLLPSVFLIIFLKIVISQMIDTYFFYRVPDLLGH